MCDLTRQRDTDGGDDYNIHPVGESRLYAPGPISSDSDYSNSHEEIDPVADQD